MMLVENGWVPVERYQKLIPQKDFGFYLKYPKGTMTTEVIFQIFVSFRVFGVYRTTKIWCRVFLVTHDSADIFPPISVLLKYF